jgi:integrase/recombinase XerD
MKPTNFAKYLTKFFSDYLARQKNVSRNTVLSYRDTFKLLIRYCQEVKKIPPEKITLDFLSSECLIDFLAWLETDRKCSIATRNQRLAALHAFFHYVQAEEPMGMLPFQKIISIPFKKAKAPVVEYLTPEAIKILLKQPDKNTPKGRRALTILSVLYDTGARVQELIDIKVRDVVLQKPATIILTGKGNKVRRVPIMKNTVVLLQHYLLENKLDQPCKNEEPLFANNQHHQLTKEGITFIIAKYVALARQTSMLVPKKIKAHMFRHSKAMHLLQAGVNLIYIRDFLGHADIKTTEIYARVDTETKRKAIENLYPDLIDSNLPDWNKDQTLLSWLSALK